MMLRREPVRNTARTLLETVDAALFQRKLEKSAKLAMLVHSIKKIHALMPLMMKQEELPRMTARIQVETVDAALFQRKQVQSAKLAMLLLSDKKDQTHHHNHQHALLKLMMPRREHPRNTAKTLLETVDAAPFQRKLEKSAKLAISPLSINKMS